MFDEVKKSGELLRKADSFWIFVIDVYLVLRINETDAVLDW
jgi:hypothetical protein